MFGFVCANHEELNESQRSRYGAVYCGICRDIREAASQSARLALQYDMVFLALLHMSLYEPREQSGPSACMLHPIKKRPWVQNGATRYAADMNVALAYYKFLDDWEDDRNPGARACAAMLEKSCREIEARYPRQCASIRDCLKRLSALEAQNCQNPDESANCFGDLMAELTVWKEDLWEQKLRQLGHALGRFIYLADAAMDYRSDEKHKKYNPFLAYGTGYDWPRWEQYLLLDMGRCTAAFEQLPLVQDKDILDNILYSGVWTRIRAQQELQRRREEHHDGRSL